MSLTPVPSYFWHRLSASVPTNAGSGGMALEPSSITGSIAGFTGNIVFFGGTDPITLAALDATWLWNGGAWQQLSLATKPSARIWFALAAYPPHGIILYGGQAAGPTYPTDTWLWDGSAWSQIVTAHNPGGRYFTQMTYDPVTAKIVLLGGADSGSTALNDTWVFDMTDWVHLTPAHSPATTFNSTIGAAMGLASTGLARFVGVTSSGLPFPAVFDWTGSDWSAIGSPAINGGDGSLAYHAQTGRSVFVFPGPNTIPPIDAFSVLYTSAEQDVVGSVAYKRVLPVDPSHPVVSPFPTQGLLACPDIDGRVTYCSTVSGIGSGTFQLRIADPHINVEYATGGYGPATAAVLKTPPNPSPPFRPSGATIAKNIGHRVRRLERGDTGLWHYVRVTSPPTGFNAWGIPNAPGGLIPGGVGNSNIPPDCAPMEQHGGDPDTVFFQNGWTNAPTPDGTYHPLAFRMHAATRIQFVGVISGGAFGTVVCTLPNWAWPRFTFKANVPYNAGTLVIQLSAVNGDVTVVGEAL